jgi:putative tricarboxylic transport membrane protein
VLENIDQVRTGAVRVLAVSGESRVPAVDAPTLREAGVGLEFTNWRGLVAPPGLSSAERAALVDLAVRLHRSASWQRAVRSNGWTDDFSTGREFGAFLAEESTRVRRLLARLGVEHREPGAVTP